MNQETRKLIEAQFTQMQLAALCHVSQSFVSQWLRGDRPIPTKHAEVIEKAMNGVVTVDDLRPDLEACRTDSGIFYRPKPKG